MMTLGGIPHGMAASRDRLGLKGEERDRLGLYGAKCVAGTQGKINKPPPS